MKTLYVSDLDGTLLNSQKKISDYSADVINQCVEKGMLFTVATARMPYGCDYRLEDIQISAPAILTNGVILYDFAKEECIHVESMKEEAVHQVIDAFQANGKDFFLYMWKNKKIYICYGDESLEEQRQYCSGRAIASCGRVYLTEDYKKECEGSEVFYFALTGKEEDLRGVCQDLDRIPGVHYAFYLNIYNGLYCLEVFSDKADKKHALLKVKEMTGCDETVVFGDNLNDLPMIELADRSYAPANALDQVKELVDEVLESCDEDGVAHFLEREILQ